MIPDPQSNGLDAPDRLALAKAVRLLEQPGLIARIADIAGEPVVQIMHRLPNAAQKKMRDIVTAVMLQSLKTAIKTLDDKSSGPPSGWLPKLITGFTGGVSGFFGLIALPVELPVTTTVMLRSIAEIARGEGESLKSARTRLACLEVFALGGRGMKADMETGYYATRAVLSQALSEAASFLVERHVVDETAPVIMRFISEIAARFGLVVSEKIAATAVPVIGALGGATVNVAFMDYFQNLARGHFIVRRLERKYGMDVVRPLYGLTG